MSNFRDEPRDRGGRPLKYETADELQAAIDVYFKQCDERTKTIVTKSGDVIEVPDPAPYTISGLCLVLDLDRQSLLNYSRREEFFDIVRRAKLRIQNDIELRSFNNNPTGAIFNLKCNFGYRDSIDVNLGGQDENPIKQEITNNVGNDELSMLKDFAKQLADKSKEQPS